MNVYEFKRRYETANPEGHFFDKATLRFFGETLRSFRVYKNGTGWRLVRVTGTPNEWLFDADFKLLN